MNEFFKPWRRKIGVLTLGLACVLTAGWIRSEYRYDCGRITGPKVSWRFGSQASDLTLYIVYVKEGDDSFDSDPVFGGNSGDLLNLYMHRIRKPIDPFRGNSLDWRLDGLGFHFGAGRADYFPQQHFYGYAIAYWSTIVPMTLLSAWLLLSKPRPPKADPAKPQDSLVDAPITGSPSTSSTFLANCETTILHMLPRRQ